MQLLSDDAFHRKVIARFRELSGQFVVKKPVAISQNEF